MSDTLAIILITVLVAAVSIVRFACIERRRRAKINHSWRKGQALREREIHD